MSFLQYLLPLQLWAPWGQVWVKITAASPMLGKYLTLHWYLINIWWINEWINGWILISPLKGLFHIKNMWLKQHQAEATHLRNISICQALIQGKWYSQDRSPHQPFYSQVTLSFRYLLCNTASSSNNNTILTCVTCPASFPSQTALPPFYTGLSTGCHDHVIHFTHPRSGQSLKPMKLSHPSPTHTHCDWPRAGPIRALQGNWNGA